MWRAGLARLIQKGRNSKVVGADSFNMTGPSEVVQFGMLKASNFGRAGIFQHLPRAQLRNLYYRKHLCFGKRIDWYTHKQNAHYTFHLQKDHSPLHPNSPLLQAGWRTACESPSNQHFSLVKWMWKTVRLQNSTQGSACTWTCRKCMVGAVQQLVPSYSGVSLFEPIL